MESDDLPSLPTVKDRTAWLLGKATGKTPPMVRPLIRSMLLPKLEALDSESLTAALTYLQETVLPWLIGDSSDEGALYDDDAYVLA